MSINSVYKIKKINDIEIKILRENEECYIKIVPVNHKSTPKKIFICINNENYNWDIYDQNGRDMHKIYLKGKEIEPCFYLIDQKETYEIICKLNKIIVNKISNNNGFHVEYKNNCISSKVTFWGVNTYRTSRKEKSPFIYM